MHDGIQTLGLVAAVVMPFWNIPLIVKIIRRRSSKDISMSWALGVWACILLMAPSGFQSTDVVWRTFNIINVFFFTAVVAVTLRYRKGAPVLQTAGKP